MKSLVSIFTSLITYFFMYFNLQIFVENSPEVTTELLEKRRGELQKRTSSMKVKEGEIVEVMQGLKTHLYAKFGDNINLES